MKIIDLLKNEKVCISCELFPPKAGTELQNALNIVSDIAEVGPHFMSVTYGAGGTSVGQTVAIARAIEASGRPALAHLTCIDADEAKIDGVLAQMRAAGVQNVLALDFAELRMTVVPEHKSIIGTCLLPRTHAHSHLRVRPLFPQIDIVVKIMNNFRYLHRIFRSQTVMQNNVR